MSTKGGPNGWGGSCRGGLGHAGVRWVMQGLGGSYRDGVGYAGVGGSYRGGSCRVQWVIQGWAGVGHAWVGWVTHGLQWDVENFTE